jgi:pilus assembly protein CpaC
MVLPAPATNVFIADPTVADVQVANPTHVFVFGKKAGRTSLYALGVDGILLRSAAVEVFNPTARAQQLTTATPGSSDIHVGNTANGLVLEGTASDPAAAAMAERSAAENAPDKAVIDDRVKVRSSAQVMLRVRIAEVDRTVTKQFGINWNGFLQAGSAYYGIYTGRTIFTAATGATGLAQFQPANPLQSAGQPGSIFAGVTGTQGGIDGVIDALAEEGLVTILAQPTLTALSGESASFLAGGEFPIPVSQALGVTTIDFKSYGVSLNFVPTVLAENHISLHVKPEVSQISSQGAITISGLQIPALTVRRADTTVELGSGQSLVIGGLLQDNDSNDIQRYPGLGDLPVLGALFRSTSFQHNESELLIVVTPYIVQPISDPRSMRYPTDAWQPASDLERIMYGFIASPNPRTPLPGSPLPQSSTAPHLLGAAGFEVE